MSALPALRLLAVSWLLLLLSPHPAAAGDGTQARAIELARQAEESRRAGDPAAALERYKEAYRVLPTPVLLWPMAELRLQLRQPLQGLQSLRLYREQVEPSLMRPGRRLEDVARLEAQLAALVARLVVRCDEPGAQVLIDGEKAQAGRPVEVDPGAHRVEVRGERGAVKEVRVGPGEELEVAPLGAPPARVEPAPAPPPAPVPVAVPAVRAAPPGLRIAKWTLLGAGLAGVLAGGVLLGVDGHQIDYQPPYRIQLDTLAGGATLLGLGAAALGVSVALFVVDRRAPVRGGRQ